MAQPRWKVGSFLQQAVAGVESKLDLILADEEQRQQIQPKSSTSTKNQSGNLSRSSSNARKNERLQERLARAVVKSNTTGNSASQSSSRVSSPVTSPVPSNGARSSMDIELSLGRSSLNLEDNPQTLAHADESSIATSRTSHDNSSPRNSKDMATSPGMKDDADSQEADSERSTERSQGNAFKQRLQETETENDNSRSSEELAQNTMANSGDTVEPVSNDIDKTVAQVQAEYKAAESRWQEEMYEYIERIDALQSKLKYLTKEAAESAKKAAAAAEPGSVERQLREKDEKIALLFEEGQKLSKSEMDRRTAIKKLRQQLAENSKSQTENQRKTDKLERDLASADTRAKRAEAAEKRANESLASQSKTSRDLEAVTAERDALSQTVQEMQGQLARAVARAEAAEAKAQSDALEQEKRHAAKLEGELASTKAERDESEERLKIEIRHLKSTMEQEKERARMLEVELKNEQSVLENKMESLRFRAEEASAGVASDTQAKLLRQIETLQTQYAVARENWQALEGSLLARLTNVEKERDEAARREGDLRRKIREVNLKARKADEDLENAKEVEHDLENKLEERMQELQKLEQKLKKAANDLTSAQKDFAEQRKLCEATWTQKLEEERARWREQVVPPAIFTQQQRTESPIPYSRRQSNFESICSPADLRSSRRSSMLPTMSPDLGTPMRQNSFPMSTSSLLSPPANSANFSHFADTPSITFEPDAFSARSGTPSAYGGALTQHPRGINDIISESTVGAGPSVQLVERMSATVRRLESERAATKDELARIVNQRDEARQQVVDLMRESEEKKTADARIQELEKRFTEINERYETTLEMLGEKSEQVEELQADIADLKRIYRELADSTMK
ncbi:TATA element modulatory factor 1 TATA binding-domain-containing protein [Aspergillus coremiiformis]|uniref:TATA element modulatory factor 1 TATA binding-domain-containing protein n=1 Tax=Aspergillus coremiiformis TaxID=138285 RepID=A0A5N6ZD69_9EURO|nr:TATA element modulatory factor 1 TATA binding-domain-containing protein [Aspergillus coremiiformis]